MRQSNLLKLEQKRGFAGEIARIVSSDRTIPLE
jgi:hypothetical protein